MGVFAPDLSDLRIFFLHLQPARGCPAAGTTQEPRGSGKRPRPGLGGDAVNPLFFSSLTSLAIWGKGRRAEGIGAGCRRREQSRLLSVPALQSRCFLPGYSQPQQRPRAPSFVWGGNRPVMSRACRRLWRLNSLNIFFLHQPDFSPAAAGGPRVRLEPGRGSACPPFFFFLAIPPNSAAPRGAIASLFSSHGSPLLSLTNSRRTAFL